MPPTTRSLVRRAHETGIASARSFFRRLASHRLAKGPDGSTFIISWSEEEFIRDATQVFAKDPFYENAIVNKPDSYGGMTQVLSSYESHRVLGDKPFERGVNSFQLLNDGRRWWIVSIFWDSERPDNPLPAKLAKK